MFNIKIVVPKNAMRQLSCRVVDIVCYFFLLISSRPTCSFSQVILEEQKMAYHARNFGNGKIFLNGNKRNVLFE